MYSDFRYFSNGQGTQMLLAHSAKGSTWDNHKYIKKVDGKYFYKNTMDKLKGASEKGKTVIQDQVAAAGGVAREAAMKEIDALSKDTKELLRQRANELAQEVIADAKAQLKEEIKGMAKEIVNEMVDEELSKYGIRR